MYNFILRKIQQLFPVRPVLPYQEHLMLSCHKKQGDRSSGVKTSYATGERKNIAIIKEDKIRKIVVNEVARKQQKAFEWKVWAIPFFSPSGEWDKFRTFLWKI